MKKILLTGAAVSAIMTIVALRSSPTTTPDPQSPPGQAVITQKTAPPPLPRTRELPAGPDEKSAPVGAAKPEPADRSWRQPSPVFRGFIDLIIHPLVADRDDRLQEALRDDSLREQARTFLLEVPAGPSLNLNEERRRLDAVEYLTTAVAMLGKDDPARDHALQTCLEILVRRRQSPEQDTELRRSLLGDRVEIGTELALSAPEAWRRFRDDHPDLQPLTDFIDERAGALSRRLSRQKGS